MKLQLLICIALVALIIVFAVSYLKEFLVKTEGFDGTVPTCTYTAVAIPNAYIPNCSGTSQVFLCNAFTTLADAQAACNADLGCKGITARIDPRGVIPPSYTPRSGYVADATAPVASTVTSLMGESSYVITNLAVCKPNWQNGPTWQMPVEQVITGSASSTSGASASGATKSSQGAGAGSVTIPGGTMVLTAAGNTMWANSMASQPAPLKNVAIITAAGPGAGTLATPATPATAATAATAATTGGV